MYHGDLPTHTLISKTSNSNNQSINKSTLFTMYVSGRCISQLTLLFKGRQTPTIIQSTIFTTYESQRSPYSHSYRKDVKLQQSINQHYLQCMYQADRSSYSHSYLKNVKLQQSSNPIYYGCIGEISLITLLSKGRQSPTINKSTLFTMCISVR